MYKTKSVLINKITLIKILFLVLLFSSFMTSANAGILGDISNVVKDVFGVDKEEDLAVKISESNVSDCKGYSLSVPSMHVICGGKYWYNGVEIKDEYLIKNRVLKESIRRRNLTEYLKSGLSKDEVLNIKADLYCERGYVSIGKVGYDTAIDAFNKAISFKPAFPEAYYLRASAYIGKKDYDNAIKDCDQSIAMDDKLYRAYAHRGIAYYHKKDYKQAIKDLSKSIELNSSFAKAFYFRALTYHQLAYIQAGDYGQALSDYNKAIELDSMEPLFFISRALSELRTKDYIKMWRDARKAESLGYSIDSKTIAELEKYKKRPLNKNVLIPVIILLFFGTEFVIFKISQKKRSKKPKKTKKAFNSESSNEEQSGDSEEYREFSEKDEGGSAYNFTEGHAEWDRSNAESDPSENDHNNTRSQNNDNEPSHDCQPNLSDSYKILGLSEDASIDEIKIAYRKRANEYHPDKTAGLGEKIKDTAEEEMKKINNAYELIMKTKGVK